MFDPSWESQMYQIEVAMLRDMERTGLDPYGEPITGEALAALRKHLANIDRKPSNPAGK